MPFPNLIVIDVDGVLTDGRYYYNHLGEKFKSFHCSDNRAIAEFVAAGFEVHLVTASSWAGMEHYARNLKVQVHISDDKDAKTKELFGEKPYIAIGDDVFDLKMLKNAAYAFCPNNSDPVVKALPNIVCLDSLRGGGIMAELARKLL